nr:alcohol dehydrogenase catalytic domain-containing protein [Xanthomonas fragariae]
MAPDETEGRQGFIFFQSVRLDLAVFLHESYRPLFIPTTSRWKSCICGVCHSDLHTARNDWGWIYSPIVPGHEIVGRVIEVGAEVSRYRVGDHVAVGCMVDSCQQCDQWRRGEEQLCREGNTGTYAGRDRITGETTQGGYSKHLVVREEFCLQIPKGLDVARAAPLLCASITSYSLLRIWNVGSGSRVGVIGLGGLGHMAVKLAAGMGADVTVLSRSPSKREDALVVSPIPIPIPMQ